MTGESWKIYWNEYVKDTNLYGSQIRFHARDDIELKNELMSPGTVIKKWFSKTNYQSMQIEPTLPMIDGEGRYHISLDASAEPADGLLLNLIFYDRYDSKVESQIIRDGEGDFQCPLKTFSYEVQLVNAGAKEFHFHSIIITEIADGEEKTLSYSGKSKERKGGRKKFGRRRAERKDGGVS